jgi:TolA-binding protein
LSETEQNSSTKDQQAGLRQAIAALLQTVDPGVARAIYRAAVPHWMNRALLRRFTDDSIDLTEILETLVNFQFARLDSQGRLLFRDEVRDLLLEQLRQDSPEEYLETTRIALTYLEELIPAAAATERPTLEREALYHHISLDEASGLFLLNEKLTQALYFRQLGEAERLVKLVALLRGQLGEEGRLWLLYFDACLDLVYRRNANGEAQFRNVIKESSSPILAALAHWKLGQIRVDQQRWSEAIQLYKTSIKTLSGTGKDVYLARVWMSLGSAYCDLAEKSGGLAGSPQETNTVTSRLAAFLFHFPFLILKALVRHISFIPSFYFDSNYQDWIIAYLMSRAAGWFRRAERLFAMTENQLEVSEARLALAKVEHQLGGWSRARLRYATLENTPAVNQSQYRTAKVRLGQGQADLEEGNVADAIAHLSEAERTFQNFQDTSLIAITSFLLGQALEKQGRPANAAEIFLQSCEAYQVVGDHLSRTRVLWSLETLTKRFQLPSELRVKVDSLLYGVAERECITRFPEGISRFYRRLAALLAFPITYGLTVFTGLLGILFLLIAIENGALQFIYRGGADLLITLVNLMWLVLLILAAFWTCRGIYSITGLAAVYLLGSRLSRIEREQPIHLAKDGQGIERYSDWDNAQSSATRELPDHSSGQSVQKLAWADITRMLSVDFKLWRQPIYLISRTLLQANSDVLTIEGMTAGYESFKKDIEKTLADQFTSSKIRNYDFSVLGNWTTPAVVLFSLIVSIIFYMIGQIEILMGSGANATSLPVSSVVAFGTLNLILVLMAVVLWRLWRHRTHLEKEVGHWESAIPTWLILAAAVFSTLIAAGWLLLQALLP